MALNVISTIDLDMQRPNAIIVNAVQYDRSGRVVRARLFNNGEIWTVPSNVYPVIRFRKSDRLGGFYDVDENGTYAINFINSRTGIEITLAQQVLTAVGNVDVQINFYNSSGQAVSTFAFKVRVQASVFPDSAIISSEYYSAFSESILTAIRAKESASQSATAAEQSKTQAAQYAENASNWSSQMPTLVSNWLGENFEDPPVDKTLTLDNAAADAKITGDVLRNGNLVQFVKTSPFVIGSGVGEFVGNRAIMNIEANGSFKMVRSNTSPTTRTFGLYFKLHNNDRTLTGHKLYLKVEGITTSNEDNFNYIYGYFSSGHAQTTSFSDKITATNNYFRTIVTLEGTPALLAILAYQKTVTEGEYWTFNNLQLYDLTEMFGAGYEPSIEEFEAVYTASPYPQALPIITSDLSEEKILYHRVIKQMAPDASLTESGIAADAKVTGLVSKYKNIVQFCKNPLTIGAGIGELQKNRADLTKDSETGVVTVTRNSESTYASFGCYFNTGSNVDRTGHILYARVQGIDLTNCPHFSDMRAYHSNGTIHFGTKKKNYYSGTVKANGPITNMALLIYQDTVTNGESVSLKSFELFDLTDIFGSGYEPSAQECDDAFAGVIYSITKQSLPVDRYEEKLLQSKIEANRYVRLPGEEYNKLSKAIQQVKRKWTPKYSTMLHLKSLSTKYGTPSTYDYYEEGVEYNHIPYSGMFTVGGDVFFNRNLATFFSAVENPASILYEPQWAEGRYQATNYGAICSSFVGWLLGQEMYRGCTQLTQECDRYDYRYPEDVNIGDVQLSPDHIRIVAGINIDPDDYSVKSFVIAEQGFSKITIMSIEQFENQLVANGGNYNMYRIPGAKCRDIDAVKYATDVIADMGNNTYYYMNDEVWLYVPTGDMLYYKNEESTNYSSVSLSQLTSKTVHDVVVYNVSDLMQIPGKYYFTTNTANNPKCELLRIDTGTITVNNNIITLDSYSENATPLWYQSFALQKGNVDSTVWPAPESYAAVGLAGRAFIENDTITITPPSGSSDKGWYIRVWYKTEFGQAYKDSEFIMY